MYKKLFEEINNIDSYSKFYDSDDFKSTSDMHNGYFEGIGIRYMNLNDTFFVIDVMKNSPAERNNINKFDKILAINDISVVGISLDSLLTNFFTNDCFKINFLNYNTDSVLVRDICKSRIEINPLESYNFQNGISYLKINSFPINIHEYFVKEIEKLNQTQFSYLIVDLRDNPGGSLEGTVEVLDEFFGEKDTIILIEKKNEEKSAVISKSGGLLSEAKIFVLTNKNSASASELFSLSIQDNDRGIIIGQRTYGKGVFQTDFEVDDNNFFHITVGKFFGPSGRWINDNPKLVNRQFYKTKNGRIVTEQSGVSPDINLKEDFYELQILTIYENIALEFISKSKNFKHQRPYILKQKAQQIVDTSLVIKNWNNIIIKTSAELFPDKKYDFYNLFYLALAKFLLPNSLFNNISLKQDIYINEVFKIIENNSFENILTTKDTIK
jgi:carboxyl-terminal processing protease